MNEEDRHPENLPEEGEDKMPLADTDEAARAEDAIGGDGAPLFTMNPISTPPISICGRSASHRC